jgi:sigma-E factor negative regulatory protein RseB
MSAYLMPIRPVSALALLCASFLLSSPTRSLAAGAEAFAPGEVRTWLTRIQQAASTRSFQGTFVVSGGGSVSSARILHICSGTNQFERIDALDGQARHVFRHNDVVQTVWPGKRVALIEQRAIQTSFPALVQAGDDHIPDFYDVYRQEPDRVAGHEAHVLWVKPKDKHRYGYRLWSEKVTGLLLRADVIDERGEVLETSAFSELSVGVKALPDQVLQAMKKLDGYRVERPVFVPTRLDAEGWVMRPVAPGFREVSCLKRSLDTSSASKGGGDGQLVQAIYSDGLTHVSLFIEPFDGNRHTRSVTASMGPTQTMTQRLGDAWVTVVGDVPPATLKMFVQGLERKR